MTKEIIAEKLSEVKAEYEQELKNGYKEHANDHARNLHGWIKALEWVLNNWEE